MLIEKLAATSHGEDIVVSRGDAILIRALLENAIHRQTNVDKMWAWLQAQKERPTVMGRPK